MTPLLRVPSSRPSETCKSLQYQLDSSPRTLVCQGWGTLLLFLWVVWDRPDKRETIIWHKKDSPITIDNPSSDLWSHSSHPSALPFAKDKISALLPGSWPPKLLQGKARISKPECYDSLKEWNKFQILDALCTYARAICDSWTDNLCSSTSYKVVLAPHN